MRKNAVYHIMNGSAWQVNQKSVHVYQSTASVPRYSSDELRVFIRLLFLAKHHGLAISMTNEMRFVKLNIDLPVRKSK